MKYSSLFLSKILDKYKNFLNQFDNNSIIWLEFYLNLIIILGLFKLLSCVLDKKNTFNLK